MDSIYTITCKTTGKSYVGSSTKIEDRFRRHLYELNRNNHHSTHLQRAWLKYGEEDFIFSVIEECTSDLIEREQYWIDTLDSYNNGYNTCPTAGTMLGFKFSNESKKRLSEMRKGYSHSEATKLKISRSRIGKKMPPKSLEVRKAISDRTKGESNPFFGKVHNQDVIDKIREAKLGKKHTKETREKMSASRIGKSPSKATREKLSLSKRVQNLSNETRQKLSDANKGSSNPHSKLNEETAREIKELLKERRLTHEKIGKIYGVSRQTVGLINNNKIWNHI